MGTTELPTWAVYAVSICTPGSALLGVLLTGWLNRRTAMELERRSQREEVMRLLRWAAELAIAEDERKVELGVDQLRALAHSDLLGGQEKAFVDAALESALVKRAGQIEQRTKAAGEVHALQAGPAIATDEPVDVEIPSNPAEECRAHG